jgi:nitroimidazol reductase NimA-like FMN-containing flavoprotein (pyridoxamine 5'-phosphate oxidase superfamily)
MLGMLTDSQIDQVLLTQFVGRIGCCFEGRVYVVPVTYAYEGGCIYVRSKEGEKVLTMRRNPDVCFQVDAVENMTNWRSVLLWGEYEELKTEQEQREGMKILLDKLAPFMISETVGPSHQAHAPEVIEKSLKAVAYRIRIKEKSGRFEKR